MDRRTFLGVGAGALTTGLAGCAGDDGSTSGAEDGTSGSADAASTETATPDDAVGSYSVEAAPVGEVGFDAVPETWVANNGSWADMGIALGQEAPLGVWLPSRYHTQYYDDIPGVSVDGSGIRKLWGDGGVGREQFYDLDADVHIADPNFLMNRGQWERSDVDEISENVGPFFGNSIFSRGYAWHEDYRYYSLYEAFERLSEVFRQRDRYDAFEAIHDDFQSALAPVVPGRADRPAVAVVWGAGEEPEQFYPYTVDEGTSFKHLRDLKVKDALATADVKDFHSSRGAIDYETLLEVDPEVLLVRGQETRTAEEFRNTVVSYMETHDVASELAAVENGDVYRAGPLYQGPISNLVVTERLAGDLYGAEERLFDPQRVADVVNGTF
ncbi:Fe3+-hydroxamate ABC transporter substrate-binding protein [Halobacteriales archaeon QS_6_71_20]|nr:MAG: Fe3+-hydroxamate ABC transporter substrate-binding protein [Halobacteriales archaeon QS_6_71_20]